MSLVLLSPSRMNAQEGVGAVSVVVTGFNVPVGKCGVLLFDSAKGFPKKTALAREKTFANIEHGKCAVLFSGIPYGTYAVSVFHDENGNGKLDANIIGKPKEGIGASNNAVDGFGPPTFENAAFVLDSGDKQVAITIHYLNK